MTNDANIGFKRRRRTTTTVYSSSPTTTSRGRSSSIWLALLVALSTCTSLTSSFQLALATPHVKNNGLAALQATTAIPYAESEHRHSGNHHELVLPWSHWFREGPLPQEKAVHSSRKDSQKQQLVKQTTSATEMWAKKYCSVQGLRESFGRNRNVLWGDLDVTTTRKLYKSLMPVALMDLYNVSDLSPEDLAKLAYQARVAAKLYARERCHVPGRLWANLFDGYRQWRKYGSFDCTGMSYQQVWEKYAAMIHEEAEDKEEDLTDRICLKILERSCKSNEMIDKMVLDERRQRQKQRELKQLQHVSDQLEQDVKLLLQQEESITGQHVDKVREARKFRALRAFAGVKRRMANLNVHQQQNGIKQPQPQQQ